MVPPVAHAARSRTRTFSRRSHRLAAVISCCLLAAVPAAGQQQQYRFQALNLPPDAVSTQVRDAAVGTAVGYTLRLNPQNPAQGYLEAAAWRLDGSGHYTNLHRVPPNLALGVNMLASEALGVDDHGQIGGIVDRLSPGVVDGDEGAYWADAQAVPFPLASQSSPLLDRSSIDDVDGRWAVGEGHRISGLAVGDRAWAWDVKTGNRFALLGPRGEGLTAAYEIQGRTVVGSRQWTTPDYLNHWRPMVWDLGAASANGDLSGVTATELSSGGVRIAYANGVDAAARIAVGQGRGTDAGVNHALAWNLDDPAAPPRDLHALVPGQYERSSASDVLGSLVVGSVADDITLSSIRAAAWDLAQDRMIDLHAFLPPEVVSSAATAINRSGQIVGDFQRLDGSDGVFVLTPSYRDGDADLDGDTDSWDMQMLASTFGTAGRSFFEGDFNFDGAVDIADLSLLAGAYAPSAENVPGLPPYAGFDEARLFFGLPPVPEPGSLSLLAPVGLLALRRRRIGARSAVQQSAPDRSIDAAQCR